MDRREWGWVAMLLLLPVASAGQEEVPEAWGEALFRPGVFSPSSLCGKCHTDIYEAWSIQSEHSRAWTDEAFQESLAGVGGEDRATCLMCHAPTVVLTRDEAGRLPLTREGVTCDFCHSLKGVDLARPVPFDLDVGPTKRGPLRNPGVAPHGSALSGLHTSSLLCASCHQYRNRHGVEVLSTYSEWQAGRFAEIGVPCQGCHMEIYKAKLVEGQRTEDPTRNFINLHEMPGGHSLRQLKRALNLEIIEVRADGGTQVEVEVSARVAGHKVPTGLASHGVRLVVEVAGGEKVQRQERLFRRVLTDAAGREIREVARLFTDATAVKSDNRIAPGEVRRIRFTFAAAPRGAIVGARLIYEAEPGVPGRSGRSVEFLRVEEEVF